eukprot:GEMP01092349.1.p1 GENE.GEMP01092349.1~~GEMP01092349.1.p1  ORF type:complete len:121 (+),score=12.22 GEMP01092349.1:221-583(+)
MFTHPQAEITSMFERLLWVASRKPKNVVFATQFNYANDVLNGNPSKGNQDMIYKCSDVFDELKKIAINSALGLAKNESKIPQVFEVAVMFAQMGTQDHTRKLDVAPWIQTALGSKATLFQ